jgi:hypothetical protein
MSTVGIAITQYSVKARVTVENRGLHDVATARTNPVVRPVTKPDNPGTPKTYERVAPRAKLATNNMAPKPPLRAR